MNSTTEAPDGKPSKPLYVWAIWAVAGLALGAILVDHWLHILGVLPYLVLLACPLMHMFMHHGHGKHGDHKQ